MLMYPFSPHRRVFSPRQAGYLSLINLTAFNLSLTLESSVRDLLPNLDYNASFPNSHAADAVLHRVRDGSTVRACK